MSYDISFKNESGTLAVERNITSNVRVMLQSAAFECGLIQQNEHWTAPLANETNSTSYLRALLDTILADPAGFRELEPANGFGTARQLVSFLTELVFDAGIMAENHPGEEFSWRVEW